ncbi:MAG: hypothetical protein ACOYBJ_01630 [Patescibacteria group bacterium]|jgi:hypothetical protein
MRIFRPKQLKHIEEDIHDAALWLEKMVPIYLFHSLLHIGL